MSSGAEREKLPSAPVVAVYESPPPVGVAVTVMPSRTESVGLAPGEPRRPLSVPSSVPHSWRLIWASATSWPSPSAVAGDASVL